MGKIKELQRTFPATIKLHWPSGIVYCCENHAAQLKNIGNVMGCHVAVEAYFGDTQCQNCINESKKED